MKRILLLSIWLCVPALVHAQPGRAPELSAVAFRHVSVVDVVNGRVLPEQTVIVREGRILKVGPSDQIPAPDDVLEVDGRGRFLIPGLWDMHTHWYEPQALGLFIANGVTGIRMMLGVPMHHQWRESISAGKLVGPRMRIASGVFDGPKPVWPRSISVSNEPEARAAVRQSRDAGADFIKVYELLPREAYFAIADESKKLGIPFVGHIPETILAQEAAEAGQKSIEHLTGMRLACSSQREELLREWGRIIRETLDAGESKPWIRALKELGPRIDETYDPEVASQLFALFKEKGTWHCPTLTVGYSIGHLNDPEFTRDPRLVYMSPAMRNSWNPKNDFRFRDATDEDLANRRERVKKDMKIVRDLHQAGVPLLAGTDTGNPYCFPGFSLHDELDLLVQSGLSPADALRAATVNPTRFMGRTETMGTIAEDRVADLVLLDDNPLVDIHNTRNIRGVMAAGRWFDRPTLDALLDRIKKSASREPIGFVLFRMLESENAAAAIARYRDLRENQPDRYDFSEVQLNMLGYRLLEFGRIDDAVEILRFNVELFPDSWNTYDSLGEAYLKQGNKELAAKNYRRSLELNPDNQGAVDAIKKLESY